MASGPDPRITNLMTTALNELKKHNYAAYIQALVELGIAVGNALGIKDLGSMTTKQLKDRVINSDQSHQVDKIQTSAQDLPLSVDEAEQIRLAAELFYSSWTNKEADNRGNEAKKNLNKSTRQQVFLGLVAVHSFLDKHALSEEVNDKALNLLMSDLEKQDDDIHSAIQNYETTRQKAVRYVGYVFATATALVFGGIETGMAVFGFGLLLFTNPVGWTMFGIIAASLVLGGIATYLNFQIFKSATPAVFKQIAGRDKPFQGFVQFRDKTDGGKQKTFDFKRLIALVGFSALFAIPTGVAIGALGYTSVLAMPAFLAACGLVVSASVFPPIGIALGVFVAVTIAAFQINAFVKILREHNGNFISFIKAPFAEVNATIEERFPAAERPYMNKFVTGLSYALTGLCTVAALGGLAVAAAAGANSVTAFMRDTFSISMKASSVVGLVVGGVISGLARVCSTIVNTAGAAVKILKLAFSKKDAVNKKEEVKVSGAGTFAAIVDVAAEGAFYFMSLAKPTASASLIPMPTSMAGVAAATSLTSMRSAGTAADSIIEVESVVNPAPRRERLTVAFASAHRLHAVPKPAQQQDANGVAVEQQYNKRQVINHHATFFRNRPRVQVAAAARPEPRAM